MIDFQKAKDIAIKNANTLIGDLQNIELEGILIAGQPECYEVSLSYDLKGQDPFDVVQEKEAATAPGPGLARLAKLMAYKKHYKTFLVDCETGRFKGFKNQVAQ